jgi:peptidoglycan/LPS O-acetylase OafA/YrhL
MKTTPYLSNLTPVRGIAALLTVIFHVDLVLGGGGGMLLKMRDSMLIHRLYLMVDLFFILSGFIMLHVYGQGFSDKVTGVAFKRFTIARFARVYPLHFVTLMYCIILFTVSSSLGIPKVPVLQIENSGYSILTNLLLLQSMNFHNWFSWVHASWSISTEWWMYMIFPFLVGPFLRLNHIGKAVIAFLCFVGYVGIIFYIVPMVMIPPEIPFVKTDPSDMTINVSYQYGILRCFFGFVLGMMMYQGYQQEWGKTWLANGYMIVALVLGLMLCLHFAVPDVFTVIFFPFILLAAAYGSPRINAFFASKPLQKLGDWSFSIYLTHQPLLYTYGSIMAYRSLGVVAPAGPPPKPDIITGWIMCLVFIGLTLLVSGLTYRFLEVPARRWINKKAS